ncbi:PREDICTED: heat shock 70 kDa protein 12A-like [Cyprinodon variegatus]|uniref:heat shock 70 kDa protein 12A-like n=1 Tax=Cyprinodon variegatus TaxID=28743 RepID=UPI0007426666|nr:PREDICTED: heat shock 70 kDa protein 12A-like [Cyprinodon variegatus]
MFQQDYETINFTAHEVLEGGVLQKLFEFPGNEKGGKNVLNKFKQFLGEIFCDGVWEEFEEKYQSEVQMMLNDFTCLKQVDDENPITCPTSLVDLAEKKKDIEMFFESVEGASWDEGTIRITREKLMSFFAETLQGITESLREIFTRHHSIGSIVLVGGLAESQIIHQHIIDQFGHQYKVMVPLRPQEAVLKGAVELGRNPQWVESKKKGPAWLKCLSEKF